MIFRFTKNIDLPSPNMLMKTGLCAPFMYIKSIFLPIAVMANHRKDTVILIKDEIVVFDRFGNSRNPNTLLSRPL